MRDVAGDDRAGTDDRGVANGEVGQHARAQADEGVSTDGDAAAEDGSRGEVGVRADAAFVLDDSGGVDDGVIADDCEGVDDRGGADGDPKAELGGGVDDSGGMDDGAREAVGPLSDTVEQGPAERQVAEGQNGFAGVLAAGLGHEKIVEGSKTRDLEEPGGDGLGLIVVQPDDAKAREGGGFGDDQGVATPAQHDDRIGHGDTIGRAAGVGCN